jgi:hypothetical protein
LIGKAFFGITEHTANPRPFRRMMRSALLGNEASTCAFDGVGEIK